MNANIFKDFSLELKGDYDFNEMKFVRAHQNELYKFALYRKEDFYAIVKIKMDTLKIEKIYQVSTKNEKTI
jgi:hypothetical protein